VYLIAQHDKMAERNMKQLEMQEQMLDARIRSVSGSSDGAAGEIEKAERLLARGTITEAEFDRLKANALAAH
jgi:multidrug resistance efflux pump